MSKKELHPKDYRYVVFSDEAAGFSFLTKSTATSDETIKWEDGNEYPLVKVQISSASHPFFTGEEKIIDTEGRVDPLRLAPKRLRSLKRLSKIRPKKPLRRLRKRLKPKTVKLRLKKNPQIAGFLVGML